MKRKLICIGLCVFSLSLLIGGCSDDAVPAESQPAIGEAAAASSPETVSIEEKNIEPTESPQPSANPTFRPSASASSAPSATQNSNADMNGSSGNGFSISQPAGGGNATQAPAASAPISTTPASTPPPDPNAGKTWHDDVYEDVWVVDEPARTVEEPVFETRERTYCYICDTDITGNIPAHGDRHFDRDEDFQYGGKPVQVEVGVKQVTLPEKGHWEKKLIRKAGWY